MKIIFLGTNGWFDTQTGNTISTFLDYKNFYVIFDAGLGIAKADRYMIEKKPVYLFLSHLHLDHIYGLHVLSKLEISQGLKIFVPPKSKELIKSIFQHPFMSSWNELNFPIEINEYAEGKNKIPFNFDAKKIFHVDDCYGFRLELEGKIVSHCLDTGPCDALLDLSKNSDILITESSISNGKSVGDWGHLNPEEAAKVAKTAGVKKLYITHISATHCLKKEDRLNWEKEARKIFPETYLANDEMQAIL